MNLLERDEPLAALAEAYDAAARGEGRVAVVAGEAGIGKTSLVMRFVGDLGLAARVLWGTCDDLTIPRPLGPFRDLAGAVSPRLGRALSGGAASHEIQALLVDELELRAKPTVLVLEDVHWADDATLDAVTVLGRRIASLPALLVLTVRSGEAPPGHPVHATVGSLAATTVPIELEPLSREAVATLAGADADRVYAVTAGNPFYVAELLGARPGAELPPSVANAVLGRASRLDDEARRLVELVSVVPARLRTSLLDSVMPGWAAAAEEPERRGLLEVGAHHVRLRHELARNAIRSSVPVARRRRLHAEIVDALVGAGGDPAEIVHHAELAGDDDVVAGHALVAARRAAALESNREAYSHFRRAADFADRQPLPERAALWEELAQAAYTVGRLDDAFPAIERAIATFAEAGDATSIGRCLRLLSRFHWYAGDGPAARERAAEAVATLEPLGESAELARAYSGLSQLSMLAEDVEQAVVWGSRALELAVRVGDERTRAHALVNIGTAELQVDPEATANLLEAFALADADGDRHEGTRALLNLAYSLLCWVRPEPALRYAEQALAYAQEHEVHTLSSYSATLVAWIRARAGDWADAERSAREQLDEGATVSQLLAKTVLTEIAVRRGDPDAAALLADLAEQADRTGELQRIGPVLELETEWALTHREAVPDERFARVLEQVARTRASGWGTMRIAACAALAGRAVPPVGPPLSEPHAAILRRDWADAADGFGAVGWSYDRALMLSLLEDEQALLEALPIARRLGAAPLAEHVARRLRELGATVPRGPREATRSNPLGLTARQLEVLELVASGLTNAEIAEALVVSPRTAEHHVAAVLAKLGVGTRREAARRAAELGLLSARA